MGVQLEEALSDVAPKREPDDVCAARVRMAGDELRDVRSYYGRVVRGERRGRGVTMRWGSDKVPGTAVSRQVDQKEVVVWEMRYRVRELKMRRHETVEEDDGFFSIRVERQVEELGPGVKLGIGGRSHTVGVWGFPGVWVGHDCCVLAL